MKSVDELVQELSETTQPMDIPNLDRLISEVDFDAAKKAAGEGEIPKKHLEFVYHIATRFERSEEIVEAVARLQFHYEVIHQLRLQLQKQFADNYLGDSESVVLQRNKLPNGKRSPGIKFTRWHFETFNHPSHPYNESGHGYFGSIFFFMISLPKVARNEQIVPLAKIETLHELELAHYSKLHDLVTHGTYTTPA